MPSHQTFVTRLLQRYHGSEPALADSCDPPTADQINYLCEVGLGPIAFEVYGAQLERLNPAQFSVLQSADLTTRAIYGQLEKAALELAGALQDAGVVPVFLKGISTSEQFYDPPHLRLMGDIDILIGSSDVALVMDKVAGLGYEITDDQWRLHRTFGHHHLPAAFHPATGLTVEVHTSLFGSAEFFSQESLFRPDVFATQFVETNYRGARVARFTPEFQFVFTLSKWSVDENWAINLTSVNDIIHILKKYESTFNWQTLSKWIAISPHLLPIIVALMLYLEQAGVVTMPRQLRELLSASEIKLGGRTLKCLTSLLHTYPFNARNKIYAGYARRRAHALWLSLSQPNSRDIRIPTALLGAYVRSLNYGRYNPIVVLPFRLKILINRIRETLDRT